jgi:hypothetical protein
MSTYHVVHGTVTIAGDVKVQVLGGPPPDRKHYEVGDSFEMDDKEALPLLAAGTIGKGGTLKDGERAPTNNPLHSDDDDKDAKEHEAQAKESLKVQNEAKAAIAASKSPSPTQTPNDEAAKASKPPPAQGR